jgi:uncharacterized RDD family membrane protein YckC
MTVSVSSLRSEAPVYAPADGSYRAVAAPLWRRGVASGLDWGLVFVLFIIASYPLGVIQTVGDALGGTARTVVLGLIQALGLGVILTYFAWFLSTGHTLGMRALDIHVFAYRSGREPHPVRAIARGLLSVGFFLAAVDAYGLSTGGYKESGLTDAQSNWRTAAVVGVGLSLFGGIWKLIDPDGRTLWDRLTGLVVVEDVVPTSMPDRLWTPWGT